MSGGTGAGKSSVAMKLEQQFQFRRISSGGFLRSYAEQLSLGQEKRQLQNLGDQLDEETDFAWIVNDIAVPAIKNAPEQPNWLLDAVRKARQVQHFRECFGLRVRHIHLSAPEAILQRRYKERAKPGDTTYEEVVAHPNEIASRSLEAIADQTFDTSMLSPAEIAHQILAACGGIKA
ncbi:nucleoside monophosphate kinase [Ralstonia solanacearum]|uniref:nucleoside monophosphate kinase n=1 Tax=Ralstonia solanacearum TaxID=305 RepID=UPI0018B05590|nr:nucleoside monophosphate kinase [Ralstonia solanacearum]MDC6212680.1 nucleoside monophosphate kinase [Ralstonia solanacearum]MDC6239794.1 nucleoside monophosphate kinase [Ralstonia solanacearum]MDD7803227.1 nucleoside monophosphate kinase [Ralstonia solanacearum]